MAPRKLARVLYGAAAVMAAARGGGDDPVIAGAFSCPFEWRVFSRNAVERFTFCAGVVTRAFVGSRAGVRNWRKP